MGSDEGECLNCGCKKLNPDPNSDLLDRLRQHLLPTLSDITELPTDELHEDWTLPEPGIIIVSSQSSLFLGKVSRSCDRCGVIKLYAEFNESRDPKVMCKFCAFDLDQDFMLKVMTAEEREEIAALEDDIIESELAYDEAKERLETIDRVLRGLDD